MQIEGGLTELVSVSLGGGAALPAIEPAHAATVASLPFRHRDPFDRMIVAQAITENLEIIGGDKAFDAYDVTRIW